MVGEEKSKRGTVGEDGDEAVEKWEEGSKMKRGWRVGGVRGGRREDDSEGRWEGKRELRDDERGGERRENG